MQTSSPRDYWPTDDWKTSTPQEQGVNQTLLAQLDAYAQVCVPSIHSLLLIRHGYIVFEEYYHGFHKYSYHSVSSITKSVISALIGLALDNGLLTSLDQHVFDFFPEYGVQTTDSRKQALTLRHLMSLTGGFSHEFPHEYWLHPVQLALERPMESQPGEQFYYDSQGVDILSGVLTRVTGRNAATFAYETLFKMLGIWQENTARFVWQKDPMGTHNTWHGDAYWDEKDGFLWKIDPQGNNPGAFGAHFTTREMAKLGYLYLNKGIWDGMQILPADYVTDSTRKQNNGGPPVNTPYGYLWWVTQHGTHNAFFASGYGGKFIYIIPDLDIVFIMTSTSTEGPGQNKGEVISRFVIPAVLTNVEK